jgi:hypothetical protein
LLFEEPRESADSFCRIAKHLMDRAVILLHARYIELGLADIDTDAHH